MGKKLIQKSNNRQELFNNTINHFNSENLCVNNIGSCKYRFKGNGCAIGREISDKLANIFDKYQTSYVGNCLIFDKLPKRLQRMGKHFLISIQELHDYHHYWNLNGLSIDGYHKAKLIAKTYNLKFRE